MTSGMTLSSMFLIGDLDYRVILDVTDDFFTPRKIPRKFCVVISIRSVRKGGTWRMLSVPDWRNG